MDNSKSRRSFGLVLMALGIILCLFFTFGLRYASNPEVFLSEIQNSIIKSEFDIKYCSKSPTNYKQYDDLDLGVFAFQGDSLVYWNSNAVGSKLIRRRLSLGSDTICNLFSGDYLVKSFSSGDLSFYVFKLLRTTYSIENKYFENRFCLFPFVLDVDISFDPNSEEGYPIYDSENDLLTKCQIATSPHVKPVYKHVITILVLALLILGFVLLLSSFAKVPRFFTRFRRREHPLAFEVGIWVVLFLAILFTYLYYDWQTKRENANMVATAQRLIEKRDSRFEESFYSFQSKLQADSTLREMIFSESNVLADVILGYSQDLLFDETLKSYITSLTLCVPGEEITIQPDNLVVDCDFYFNDLLSNSKSDSLGDGLYSIDYYTLEPNYLAVIQMLSADSLMKKNLYFEFYKPLAPEGFGFPKMLQANNSLKPYDYSVANYRDTLLVYKYGRYLFPSFLPEVSREADGFRIEKHDKLYSHHYGAGNTLVISTPRKGWSEITAPFGVFFLGMLVPYSLICFMLRPRREKEQKQKSFRRKMQAVVLWTLAISFLIVGPVSVIYMQSLYNQKTTTGQFETTRTLSLEMQSQIDFTSMMGNTSREAWTEILQQYASNFFTDLNLYGLDGRLIATTRQEVYDYHLQAPLMNAEAYHNMHRNKALYFIHEETLGKAKYESAYVPLDDGNGNTMAYLNTPYFSSRMDLKIEIMNFALTYINIILLLLGVALLLVLSITRRLTQPLALIQNKMREVRIDRPNEPIEWKGNDEIGALVDQYNQLIVELEQSAAELQRTTSESAWRGVARQVAHEIKNSLTPMRLSLQLLQRSVDSKADNLDERIKRTSDTLIEQIDALSDIASSFSNYAKLPENEHKPLNLAELVSNVVNLYDNTENIVFSLNYDKKQDYTFIGDKTNLNSAMSNIIKNAVQAIGSKPDGTIDVTLTANEQKYLISIKDNGRGIKEEDKKQIFLPNFTTKSGGSGVGLSLTYNIIRSAGGLITFKSQEGEGTEFVIELFK